MSERPSHEQIQSWATLVVSRIERHSIGITYAVLLENEEEGRSLMVWSKEVFFGHTDSHCAGGSAFRDAARQQDAIAEQYAGATRARRPREGTP